MDDVDKYIAGRLTDIEKMAFEERIGDDDTLREEVEFRQDLRSVLREEERVRLKSKLKDYAQTKEVTQRANKKAYAIALAVVFVVGLGVLWWLSTQGAAEDDATLYATYYHPYPNDYRPVVRGASTDLVAEGFYDYEKGDYINASSHFEESLRGDDNPSISFFNAISLHEIGQTTEAIQELEMIKDLNFVHRAEANFYLGILYLKINEISKAEQSLTRYLEVSSDDMRKEEVRELLLKMRE